MGSQVSEDLYNRGYVELIMKTDKIKKDEMTVHKNIYNGYDFTFPQEYFDQETCTFRECYHKISMTGKEYKKIKEWILKNDCEEKDKGME